MTKLNNYVLSYVSAAALAAGVWAPAPAFAQQEAADGSAADEGNAAGDVIYVTARKRQETTLEVPVSVSAFSQEGLEKRGAASISEVSDFVPGFQFQNTGQGGFTGRANPNIRFRGVGVQVAGPASRGGALFWDGAYIPDGGGILPLVDLERTEVIKGPQTAFFGRNTFSGAVNFIPAAPTDSFEGRVIAGFRATDSGVGYNAVTVLSGPITEKLRARLAFSSELKPGSHKFGDGTQLGKEDTQAIVGSLHYDITDNATIKYSGFFVDSEDTSSLASQLATVPAGACERTYSGSLRQVGTGEIVGDFSTDISQSPRATLCGRVLDWTDENTNLPAFGPANADANNVFFSAGLDTVRTAPDEFEGNIVEAPNGIGNTYELWRHHLGIESEFAGGHILNAFASIGNNQYYTVRDGNHGTPSVFGDVWYAGFVARSEDISAEIRLTSPQEGSLRYIFGVSYYEQDSLEGDYGLFTASNPIAGIVDQTNTNFGVFGAFDYDIIDGLTLSAEGRWHTDTQKLNYEGPSGGNSPAAVVDEEQQYDAFLPRVILRWQPFGPDLNIYGSYSLSYLQGNPTEAATYALRVPDAGINPETVGFFTPRQKLTAYEAGVKHRVNDRLQYTVAFYDMDWENQVFFELSPTFVATYLPGDSSYRGVEATFNANVTDWVQLSGGYNYVDAELTRFGAAGSVISAVLAPGILPGQQVVVDGNRPRYIPASSGNLSLDVDLTDFVNRESFIRFDAIYTGDFFIDNLEWNKVDGSARVNFRAGVALSDFLRAEVWGTNIFNDRSWTTAGGTTSISGSPDRKTFGPPTRGAEWGVRFLADF